MIVNTDYEGKWDTSPKEVFWNSLCLVITTHDYDLGYSYHSLIWLTALAASLGLMKIDAEDNIATMDNIYMNFIREDFF